MFIYGYFMSLLYKCELYKIVVSKRELSADYMILKSINFSYLQHSWSHAMGKHKVTIIDMSQGYLIYDIRIPFLSFLIHSIQKYLLNQLMNE